eukprot:superscaffoldBa00001807_g12101
MTSPPANVLHGLKMAPSHALRCCKRALNWIPVLFINLVVGWSYYAYVVELCVYTIPNNAERISYLVIFHIFLIMFIWSYWKTIWSTPASPSTAFALPRAEKELVNNCVGFSNYKYFVLFLAYASLYCLVICATVVQYFIKFWTKHLPDTHAKFHILFLFFVAALFFISILSLFSYHLWLVGKNRTTIEAFRAPVFTNGPDKNGFSLGFSRNVAEVFGDQAKYWIFPIFSSLIVHISQEEYLHTMEEALNGTIDPACLQEPPLAIDVIKQLDVFGFCLYAMLTLMSCISLLLYLEQCIYIYRKLPYPRKTTIIWINGAAPVIATMSCFGMWVPRAVMFTDMTSNWKMLFLLKFGALQYAILKTVLSILAIILWTNGNFDLADLDITGAAIWINPFIGILTIISLWPVAIIFMNTNSSLRSINIVPKYAMYQLQTSIINILALDGTIACAPPFSSQARGSMLSQQMMIMEMFIITLITRFLYRRTYDTLPSEAHDNNQNAKVALQASLVEHDV